MNKNVREYPLTLEDVYMALDKEPYMEIKLGTKVLDSEIEKMTPEQFIETFINDWNYKYQTVGMNGMVQCKLMARRSLGDLYLLTKFYFPEIGLLAVRNILHKLIGETIISSICPNILRRVYYKGSHGEKGVFSPEFRDEFGWLWNEPTLNIDYDTEATTDSGTSTQESKQVSQDTVAA